SCGAAARATCACPRRPGRGAGAGATSTWLDVHRDFVQLEVVLEALFDPVGDGVGGLDVGVAVDGDGHLGVAQVRRAARADPVRALHAGDRLGGLLDAARRYGLL